MSYGYGKDLQAVADAREIRVTDNRIEYLREAFTEWYVNDPHGLEQGFTFHNRPSGGNDSAPLVLRLGSSSDFKSILTNDEKGIDFIDDLGQTVLSYSGLHAWDANGKALATRMTADGTEIALIVNDSDALYPIVIDPYIQTKKLLASDAAVGDGFGGSVSVSGDTAIVGAHFKDGGAGAAYIFSRNQGGTNNWGQIKKLLASDGVANDYFGNSVSISGDTAIVGAEYDDDKGSGQVLPISFTVIKAVQITGARSKSSLRVTERPMTISGTAYR